MMARHRRELKTLLGTPPNVKNVPKSFWEKVEKEIETEAAIVLFLIFIAGASTHNQSRQAAEPNANKFAQKRASELARDMTKHTRERVQNHSSNWRDNPPSNQQLEQDLTSVLGPNRAANVAATETTNAATDGGENAVKETVGFDARDKWITREDDRVCPICFPLHETQRTSWSRKFPKGPPAHVNCRCYIEYHRHDANSTT